MEVLRPNFEKRGGLIVVVAQDEATGEILMVAYTDEAGFHRTLLTGYACFYSTSRKTAWMKGEESGNLMLVVDILVDCDGDAVVYKVRPLGNGLACHTSARSCFYRSVVNGQFMPAPKAGEGEDLALVETEVCERLY